MFKVKLVSSAFLTFFGLITALLPAAAAQAASISIAPAPIKLAVLDSGIDPSTQQFAGAILPGYNVFDSSNNTADSVGHGTWVAGTARNTFASFRANINPQATLAFLPITITDSKGLGYTSTAAAGLRRAAAAGAKIANLSFELHGGSSEVNTAAQEFVQQGGIVFAAAGNDGQRHADMDNPAIVSIGSVNAAGNPSYFSSYGPFVDLAAPGENVMTTGLGNSIVRVAGTSFAAPYAASVAALVWAANPALSNYQVIDILNKTARDTSTPGKDDRTGYGIIDPNAAIAAAKKTIAPEFTESYTKAVSPVVAQVLYDPSIPPMDPIYAHTGPTVKAAPKAVVYKYVKRYTRKWNVKTKKYYWAPYSIKVRA